MLRVAEIDRGEVQTVLQVARAACGQPSSGAGLRQVFLAMFRPSSIPKSKTKPRTPVDAENVRAKHLVYRLFEETNGLPGAWQVLRKIGDRPETVARAAERGWLVVREDGVNGRSKAQSAALTDEGRLLARKGMRR